MGRPFFSQAYSSPPAVVVRVEPEPAPAPSPTEQPVCERWTYWKPFDPDSDEFFVNEVYEAFVDPTADVPGDRGPSPVVEESSSSSSSDDESMDGRGTPIGDAPTGPRPAGDEGVGIRLSNDQMVEAFVIRRVNEQSQERLRTDLDGPRSIIPVTVNRNVPVTPPRPITPPSMTTPVFQASPSSTVDTTPRLYSWRELGMTPPRRGLVQRSYRRVSMRSDITV